ncbi:MAG: methionyl-tRNA formyltransferase [Anaerolineae bacterium]
MARVLFLGTPSFAVPILAGLHSQHEVLAVITQPDQPGGRGRQELCVPPVKTWAAIRGLMVLQPNRLSRDKPTLDLIRELKPDVLVLAAYGQILRQNVLSIAPRGCIGVHASLLPRLRGAAPIATAILRGEAQTGISLMLTDAGMDTGPVIARSVVLISATETTSSLTDKLAACGADVVLDMLPKWLTGEITPEPQDDTLATFAPPLTKEQGAIDWSLSALELDRQIRALNPWPGTFTHHSGAMIKVLEASPLSEKQLVHAPGCVVNVPQGIGVTTGQGVLLLHSIQPAGKRAMSALDYTRGHRDFCGAQLV